jgi:hypothetical protein
MPRVRIVNPDSRVINLSRVHDRGLGSGRLSCDLNGDRRLPT